MIKNNRISFSWAPRLGRWLGIEVRIHLTFLLLLGFIGLTHWLPGRSLAAAWGGVMFFALLFLCVLLHEFGHALAARQFGIKTRDITLLPIGGIARLERMPDKPSQELWVALAGPLVNVVIAGGLLVGLLLNGGGLVWDGWGAGSVTLVERVLAANVFLVLFNLLPAFPMDGGRVLRALLAMWMPATRATRIASRTGQGMAVLFGFAGLFINPMLILIALFVWIGAAQEASVAEVKSSFAGVPVRDAMLTEFQSVAPDETLGDLARRILAGTQQDFPVLDGNGRLVGLVTREGFFAALRARGEGEPVAHVMSAEFLAADPGEMLEGVFVRLQPSSVGTVPVLSGGRLVGLLTAENIGEFVMIQAAMHARGKHHWTAPPPTIGHPWRARPADI
jgi:Zn-dependent protease